MSLWVRMDPRTWLIDPHWSYARCYLGPTEPPRHILSNTKDSKRPRYYNKGPVISRKLIVNVRNAPERAQKFRESFVPHCFKIFKCIHAFILAFVSRTLFSRAPGGVPTLKKEHVTPVNLKNNRLTLIRFLELFNFDL